VKAYPELRQHNPTEPVSLEKVPMPAARDLSPEEVAALIEALKYRGGPLAFKQGKIEVELRLSG